MQSIILFLTINKVYQLNTCHFVLSPLSLANTIKDTFKLVTSKFNYFIKTKILEKLFQLPPH